MNNKLTMWLIGAIFVLVMGMGGIYLQAQTYTDKRVNEIKQDTVKKIEEVQGELRITKEKVDRVLETIIKIDERTKRMENGDRNRPR